MKLNLLSCEAPRPDRRAIANCLITISANINDSLSNLLAEYLIEGDSVEIEISEKNAGSALSSLRKLKIDYEIIE